MTATAALRRDLRAMRERAPEVGDSALAASALALARELDDPSNSATSKAMCARALTETLEGLRAQLPPAIEDDKVDDLTRRRDARRAAS